MKAKKVAALLLSASMIAAPGVGVTGSMVTAFADNASSSVTDNDSSLTNDLNNHDIVDTSQTGDIDIYKYDISAAEAAGKYTEGKYKATGQENTTVQKELKDFAIAGVQFSGLKVGDIEQYSEEGTIKVVYEIPEKLAKILGLETTNGTKEELEKNPNSKKATNMKPNDKKLTYTDNDGTVKAACEHNGDGSDKLWHYTSTQISDALEDILKNDDVAAKNALEDYLINYGAQDTEGDDKNRTQAETDAKNDVFVFPMTDANGHTQVTRKPLGLYLIVETKVPQNVTETVNPWFVSLPFTNTSYDASANNVDEYKSDHDSEGKNSETDKSGTGGNTVGGEQWVYHAYFYPKNQTGNPTMDKSVRNAYSNSSDDYANKNDNTRVNDDYNGVKTSKNLITFNGSQENGNGTSNWPSQVDKTTDDGKQYIANRGGYTLGSGRHAGQGADSKIGSQNAITKTETENGKTVFSTDYEYRDTTTASEGDLLDYIIVSKIPHITSTATYLSEYTFTDEMDKGLAYNDDFKVAFYDNKEDADSNNTQNAVEIWSGDQIKYSKNSADVDLNAKIGSSANQTATSDNANVDTGSNYMTVYKKDNTSATTLGSDAIEGTVSRVLQLTEAGLNRINGTNTKKESDKGTENSAHKGPGNGFSDYYMVVYYTVKVQSGKSVTLGDQGNQNNANLIWSRTNNSKYKMLTDRNYVYSYGIDLTKKFTGKNNNNTGDDANGGDTGDFSKVQFKLYNRTDGYYVVAKAATDNDGDGVYEVTGKTKNKDAGTTFVPHTGLGNGAGKDGKGNNTNKGKLQIRGLEADTYQLTEISTDDGYSLLKDDVDIVITATDRDIKASVEGVTGMTKENAAAIIKNYGTDTDVDTKGNTDQSKKSVTIYNEGYSQDDEKGSGTSPKTKTGDVTGKAGKDDTGDESTLSSVPRGVKNEDGEDVNNAQDNVPNPGNRVHYKTAYSSSSSEDADAKTRHNRTSDKEAHTTVNNDIKESGNGDTIYYTDMYVGQIHCAEATVDGQDATMTDNSAMNLSTNGVSSEDAGVVIEITNTKGFHLPKTGGLGTFIYAIAGVVIAGMSIETIRRRRQKAQNVQK